MGQILDVHHPIPLLRRVTATVFVPMTVSVLAPFMASTTLGFAEARNRPPCVRLVNQPFIGINSVSGTGTTELLLRNQTNKAAELALTGMPSASGSPWIRVAFSSPSSNKVSTIYEASIPPKTTLAVEMTIQGDWNDGASVIELMNHYGTENVGRVQLQRIPRSIRIDNPKLDWNLLDGKSADIIVINDDPVGYPVHWELVNNEKFCEGDAAINPKSSSVLECTPHSQWHWAALANAIKTTGPVDGYRLLLLPRPLQPSVPPGLAVEPIATFRGRGSWNYYGSLASGAIKYFTLFTLLALGGLTSLALSYYIPNKLLRLDLRDKLLELAARTSDLSSRVDSRLAVMVRLERSRLVELLHMRGVFSPEFATIARQCRIGIERVLAKVSILEQMDIVLGRLEERQVEGVPPTRVDQIHGALNDAKVLLSKSEMGDDDIRAARLAIELASKQVDALNDRDDEFGRQLAASCHEVATALTSLSDTPAYQSFSSLMNRPIYDVNAVTGQSVEPENYVDLDFSLNKARIIRSYIRLRGGITANDVVARLEQRTDILVNLLQKQSWDGLRSARLLLREMEDDIYPERIIEAVQASMKDEQSREVTIQIDPPYVYERAPVEFGIRFYSPAIDTCAAREEFVVEWDYNDGHRGEGWLASHYFLRSREVRGHALMARRESFTVSARLIDPSGKPVQNGAGITAVLSREVVVHQSELGRAGERTRAEIIKLGAALLIAAVGLVSGAQGQIDKLDLIPGLVAIFLVGFSADSIKRLLTSSSS
jgi:hypothetical protein